LIVFYGLKSPRQFAMPPENAGSARTSDEWKRPFRARVNRRIEFANNVIQHSRRDDENRPAIAAVRRVADAID
jgi:hypothetical protein